MINEIIEDNIVIAELENGKTNTITHETLKKLKEIIDRVNEDDSLKGIVLTGKGRFFSSGFNLPMFLGFKDLDEVIAFFEEEEQILINLFSCDKPVVSAINGHCAAMGLIMSMAADYRIAKDHPKIKIGMSEIKIGLGLSLAQADIMMFGLDSHKKYRNVMFNGQMHDVKTSKELGIIDETVETDEELIKRAKEIIVSWIDNPGRAFIQLKKVQKDPVINALQKKLNELDWRTPYNCFFDEKVRKTLEVVHSMLGEES